MCLCALRVQKRVLNSLGLELQVVVSGLKWVLGSKPVSFLKAVHALNH